MLRRVWVQVVHTRCVGPQYSVILKKMLRCVDHLPLTPNDIHTASSAHGSFGDVLHQLCKHTDLEVRLLSLHQKQQMQGARYLGHISRVSLGFLHLFLGSFLADTLPLAPKYMCGDAV